MTFSPGRTPSNHSLFSVAFTKFHAGLLLGVVFVMMAVSFSLGFAVADRRTGQEEKEAYVVSRKNVPAALERKVLKATIRISPSGGNFRLAGNNGKKKAAAKIRPSFFKALLEKGNPKQGKIIPLQLKAISRQSPQARPSREPDMAEKENLRGQSPGSEPGKYNGHRSGPAKVSFPVRQDEIPRKYTIQIISVQKPARAIRITRKLQEGGFSAFIQPVELGGKGARFRIRVGRFSDRRSALRVLENLRSRASVQSGKIVPF